MDTLKFTTTVVSLPVFEEENRTIEERFILTQIFINGIELKGAAFDEYGVLVGHDADYKKFNLFTCTCGVPECAGYFDQVIQRKSATHVSWELPADIETSPRTLVFDVQQYLTECALLEHSLNEAYTQGVHLYSDRDYISSVYEIGRELRTNKSFSHILAEARQSFKKAASDH